MAKAIFGQIKSIAPEDLVVWVETQFKCRIIVRPADLSKRQCRGLVYFDPFIKAYRIFIEKTDAFTSKRFTLCHELGHIMASQSLRYGFLEKDGIETERGQERFCNRFAAAFLMPDVQFKKEWHLDGDTTDGHRIIRMGFKFNVSTEAARYRATELVLLTM